jgi:hypothetical protein
MAFNGRFGDLAQLAPGRTDHLSRATDACLPENPLQTMALILD